MALVDGRAAHSGAIVSDLSGVAYPCNHGLAHDQRECIQTLITDSMSTYPVMQGEELPHRNPD